MGYFINIQDKSCNTLWECFDLIVTNILMLYSEEIGRNMTNKSNARILCSKEYAFKNL